MRQLQLEPGDRTKSPKTDRPGGHRSGRTLLKNPDSVSNGRHSGNLTVAPVKSPVQIHKYKRCRDIHCKAYKLEHSQL